VAKNRHTIIYPDARWDAHCSTAATRGITETGKPWSVSEFIRRATDAYASQRGEQTDGVANGDMGTGAPSVYQCQQMKGKP
jgi:hypothetical protein